MGKGTFVVKGDGLDSRRGGNDQIELEMLRTGRTVWLNMELAAIAVKGGDPGDE